MRRANVIRWGALAVGVILFAAALYYINLSLAVGTIRRLGVALPLALLFSGLWHLSRTLAWSWCFPQPRRVSFLRLTESGWRRRPSELRRCGASRANRSKSSC